MRSVLEQEYGSPSYKLCLQHRDCPSAGAYGLSETIGQAVEASKRTIMVISPNFMKAEWCRFEYKSALHQVTLPPRFYCLSPPATPSFAHFYRVVPSFT